MLDGYDLDLVMMVITIMMVMMAIVMMVMMVTVMMIMMVIAIMVIWPHLVIVDGSDVLQSCLQVCNWR